jgi:2-enoate reductase
MTFPLEIIETINDASQGDLPIIFRFALTHKIPGGRTEEEGLEVCQIVEDAGVGALDVDAGCYENLYWPHPPTYQPPACMLDMAAKAKQGVKNIPVMGVGKLNYPDIAVQAVVEGKADFVVIGRGLLADPEWANKTRSGRVEEIRPCIGCHEACLSRLRRKSTSCAVNTACGEERALRLTPAERKKRILVVGAGPAGMEAARVATLRGHKVTLYEKSGALGGKLLLASVPDFKQDLRILRKYYEQEMERLGVELVLNTEATAEKIIKRKPDVVFLASGAVQRIPEVPGIDSPKVTTAIDVLSGKAAVGKDAVIVGGGMTGCELAVHLAQKGKRITIMEEFPRILNDMNHVHANREMLRKMLEENDITILTNTGIVEVTEAGLKVVNTSFNKSEIPTDTVIIAAGLVSHDTLFDALWDKIDEVYRIGGCVTPGKIIDAIWDGYRRARII